MEQNTIDSKLDKNLDHLPKKKKTNLIHLVFGILALLLVVTSGFLYIENANLKKQLGLSPKPLLPKTCDYNGVAYQPGEGFPSTDGCNSCSCTETGEVTCTLMVCDSDTEQIQTDQTTSWKTYSASSYSFKYPPKLHYAVNPRNFADSTPVYFFVSDKSKKEYLDCLSTGKKQVEMDRQNITVTDWVDWEGACDIGKVIYNISFELSKNPYVETLSQKYETQDPVSGIIISQYTDIQGRDWYVEDPVWGMGDDLEVRAELNRPDRYVNVNIRTNSRALETYTNTPMMLQQGDAYSVKPSSDHMNQFIRLFLSTIEFTQ